MVVAAGFVVEIGGVEEVVGVGGVVMVDFVVVVEVEEVEEEVDLVDRLILLPVKEIGNVLTQGKNIMCIVTPEAMMSCTERISSS